MSNLLSHHLDRDQPLPEDELARLTEFLNGLKPTIDFTLETESERSISFLDIRITKGMGDVKFSVYRKPTHSGAYLHRDSCHPDRVFRIIVSCLGDRARKICSGGNLQDERKIIRESLRVRGYGENELRVLNGRRKDRLRGPEANLGVRGAALRKGVIPYVPGLSERIGRVFRKVGVEIGMKSSNTIGNILVRKRTSTGVERG